jgi:hypothetical protein
MRDLQSIRRALCIIEKEVERCKCQPLCDYENDDFGSHDWANCSRHGCITHNNTEIRYPVRTIPNQRKRLTSQQIQNFP